jgi:hypothetical protein
VPRFAATFKDGPVEWTVIFTAEEAGAAAELHGKPARDVALAHAGQLAGDGGHPFTEEHIAQLELQDERENRLAREAV